MDIALTALRILLIATTVILPACGSHQRPTPEQPKEDQKRVRVEDGVSVRSVAGLRYRTYADGAEDDFRWRGIPIPKFVPARIGDARLSILDPLEDGYFALYRPLRDDQGPLTARVYEKQHGALVVDIDLRDYMQDASLEVQDARYSSGVLYFNEVCQQWSVATEASHEPCGELIAVNARDGQALWISKSHVSSGQFLLLGGYALATFTATLRFLGSSELPDVYLINQESGEVVASDEVVLEDGFFGFDETDFQTVGVVFNHTSADYTREGVAQGELVRSSGARLRPRGDDPAREQALREIEAASQKR